MEKQIIESFFIARQDKIGWASELRAKSFLERALSIDDVLEVIASFNEMFEKDIGGFKKYIWGLDQIALEDFLSFNAGYRNKGS